MIQTIFAKQRELMEKYEEIEHNNGFQVPTNIPLDINDKFDQARIKEFAWRITEELAEVMQEIAGDNMEAAKEELADVLHFMAELTILLGFEDQVENTISFAESIFDSEIGKRWDSSFLVYSRTIYNLSLACHKLKNKPWKQSYRETDLEAFKAHFRDFWMSYLTLCTINGLSIKQLFHEYHKKHQVNVDRQNSGY